jgi:ribonuclease HI
MIESYGANASTSNNEMELQAINEALLFIPNVRSYVVIESDSQGCLNTMLGAGERWMADNYIRLNGERVKKGLVDNITLRLRTVNAEFRKIKAHNGDQWNERADALAVMGRDEAIAWPRCSFDVITAAGRIPFRSRAMRPLWTLADVRAQLVTETEIKLPEWRELNVFKDGNRYDGLCTDVCYQLVHKSLPPPAAGAPAAAVKPVPFGVFNGRSFTPTHPMHISRISEDQRLDEFKRAVPGI